MKQTISSSFRLGILGGGQLGKMLCQAASTWDVSTHVLDPDPEAAAASIATKFVHGSFRDYETVMKFAQDVDLLTIEIEGVNIEAIEELEKSGLPIYPEPSCLRIIRDKGLQKQFFITNNLPTANFALFDNASAIRQEVASGNLQIPFVQKTRLSGYDGQGVLIVKEVSDLDLLFGSPSLVEFFVPDAMEIGVIVSRNKSGEMECYPPVEMIFNPVANLVEYLLAPARISDELIAKATEIALKAAEAFQITGLLAVELFIDKDQNILINEVAPRPHNSGHHTIESAITSQYEQHLRAIFGYHPGSTKLKMPAVMVNILGQEGFSGPVVYKGLNEVLGIDGVKLHIYGKIQTRPYRKMGHATILDTDAEQALEKAKRVLSTLKAQA
ncbi:MAG: 5-(carboxyamino)imidazole ribonucleotide synthase [Bacteroidetes bacterium HGW-Bacteroidetes-1]|jgi:5-(carboxyamino)imidazole ribonucleotide synthase|nr:MAG: 5-(carboxyamino)imidazole ribonucleotide synthase [Bacteroidetes bacterium HGW-Bacteroidetes-1]